MPAARPARLYRAVIENTPGQLAAALAPFAKAGSDLQVVMAYRQPGDRTRAAVEVYPVEGRRLKAAAAAAGFAPMATPMIVVEGKNRAGEGERIAAALARAGINLQYLVVQVVGRRYAAVFGFESDRDARTAARIITRASRTPSTPPKA
jgi:hypothetical protein